MATLERKQSPHMNKHAADAHTQSSIFHRFAEMRRLASDNLGDPCMFAPFADSPLQVPPGCTDLVPA